MAEVNKEDLKKALDKDSEKGSEKKDAPKMPKPQEIGFHQGALNTLVFERNELVKMIQNVEKVMQAHMKRLEELGVKIETKKKE